MGQKGKKNDFKIILTIICYCVARKQGWAFLRFVYVAVEHEHTSIEQSSLSSEQ
jgi:hypothetical protein